MTSLQDTSDQLTSVQETSLHEASDQLAASQALFDLAASDQLTALNTGVEPPAGSAVRYLSSAAFGFGALGSMAAR